MRCCCIASILLSIDLYICDISDLDLIPCAESYFISRKSSDCFFCIASIRLSIDLYICNISDLDLIPCVESYFISMFMDPLGFRFNIFYPFFTRTTTSRTSAETTPLSTSFLHLDQVDMDPSLWSVLPQNLLERILVALPFKSISRCRCLSTHFKKLLYGSQLLMDRCRRHASLELDEFVCVAFVSEVSGSLCYQTSAADRLSERKKFVNGRHVRHFRFGKKVLIARFHGYRTRKKRFRGKWRHSTMKTKNPGKESDHSMLLFDLRRKMWMKPMRHPRFRLLAEEVCVARHLLLGKTSINGKRTLVLLDPVISTFQMLPPLAHWKLFEMFGTSGFFTAADNHLSYQVLVLHLQNTADRYYTCGLLSSSDFQWHLSQTTLPTSYKFKHSRLLFARGAYYCLVYSSFLKTALLKVVVTEDEFSWEITDIRERLLLSKCIECHDLLSEYIQHDILICIDRIFLVVSTYARGQETEFFANVIEQVMIWEMDRNKNLRLQAVIPRNLLRQIDAPSIGPYWKPLECCGHKEFMVFGYRNPRRFLMYNLLNDLWEISPSSQYTLLSMSFCWAPL